MTKTPRTRASVKGSRVCRGGSARHADGAGLVSRYLRPRDRLLPCMSESVEGESRPQRPKTRDHQARSLAILAASAALLGSVVGAGGGLVIADRQISAGRSDASREERKTLYAELVSEMNALHQSARAIQQHLEDGTQVPSDLAMKACDEAAAVDRSYSVLLLVGPDDVNAAAYFMAGDASHWCSVNSSGEWAGPSHSEKPEQGESLFDDGLTAFVIAAGNDLKRH